MRKRLVRALIFIAIAVGASVGGASAAGALDLGDSYSAVTDGTIWD